MKITEVMPYPIFDGRRSFMLVKVSTDEGIEGWGEAGVTYRELAVAGAITHYRELLVGQDPMDIGAHWQRMYRSQYFEGGRILTGAISAIDIALHDIKGKALGIPVHQLLGGKQRDYVPAFCTAGGNSNDEVIENAKEYMQNGWQAIRVGWRFPWGDDVVLEPIESIAPTAKLMTQVRTALGDDIILGLDYHHRLSVPEAVSFCNKMQQGTIDFLEEPIRDESIQAYRALRSMVDVPFAIGEEMSSKWQFLPYIEENLTQFARLDICNIGGFTEAMKVIGWCEAHYIDLMPHNPLGPVCAAASIHMCAASAGVAWFETGAGPTGSDNFSDEMFPTRPKVDNGRYAVPTAPGLGIEVNEEAIKAAKFEKREFNFIRKRDGSYTNW